METMKTGKEAVAIMISEYNEKRKMFGSEIRTVKAEISAMRSNAKNRPERERYLEQLKKTKAETEENIHELDSLEVIIEEYEELHNQIVELCEKKRALFFNPVIESNLITTKRDGFCCVL